MFLFQDFMHFTNHRQILEPLEHCQIKDTNLANNPPSAGHQTIS